VGERCGGGGGGGGGVSAGGGDDCYSVSSEITSNELPHLNL
jgi:hypothetical protein